MPTNFDLAEATINFTAGTEAVWNNFTLPIPENVIIYTVDTKKFKKGDGSNRFSNLADGPSISGINSGEETVANVLVQLAAGDDDSLIIIDNELFKASTTKLSTLLGRLNAVENANTIQNSNMDAITSQLTMLNAGIIANDNDKLVIVGSGQMKPGVLPESLVVAAEANPINIRSFKFYADANMTEEVESMYYNSTYYANVHVQHDTADVDNISIGLTETNDYVTIEHVSRGVFKVIITALPITETVQFTATGTYNTDTVSLDKSMQIVKYNPILVAVYGGSGNESFQNVVIDSADNIYAAGWTTSEGLGGPNYGDALIVKFDSNLNILVRKRYGGTSDDIYYSIAIDSSDNIYAAGWTTSEVFGGNDCLIVKFDTSLNALIKKRYGGTGVERFYNVGCDSSGNVYAIGYSNTEGTETDALIVKFDSSLNILARKIYGGTNVDVFESIGIDASGNIYVGGATRSEGSNVPTQPNALIVKFDSSLNILARKYYGGTGYDRVLSVLFDSSGNVYCLGDNGSEGTDPGSSHIIKFDSNLNVISKKLFTGVPNLLRRAVMKNDIMYVVALISNPTTSAAVIKIDTNFNIVGGKMYGVNAITTYSGIQVDSLGNILCVGETHANIIGNQEALIVKFPSDFKSGTYAGSVINQLVFSDIPSIISISDSSLAVANSTLTLANSTLTLAAITSLTLADSVLTLTKDTIYCH